MSASDYDRLLSVIGEVIRDWDPYALLAGGAPRTEFDDEIARLAPRLHGVSSAEEATRAVVEVFSAQFGAADFGSDQCEDVGQRLFTALREAGLLTRS